VDGFDPRIHGLYFCPQLYRKEDGGLVPLSGQEIGQLMAQALEGGAIEKSPWYEPSDSMPKEPIIESAPELEFDSLVVDAPSARANEPATLLTGDSRERKS
jgi:Mrp family chromosome partitioning ATPase